MHGTTSRTLRRWAHPPMRTRTPARIAGLAQPSAPGRTRTAVPMCSEPVAVAYTRRSRGHPAARAGIVASMRRSKLAPPGRLGARWRRPESRQLRMAARSGCSARASWRRRLGAVELPTQFHRAAAAGSADLTGRVPLSRHRTSRSTLAEATSARRRAAVHGSRPPPLRGWHTVRPCTHSRIRVSVQLRATWILCDLQLYN